MEESEIDWDGLKNRMVRFSVVKGFSQSNAEEFAEEVIKFGRKQIKKIPNMKIFNFRLKHWWVKTAYKNIKNLYSELELIAPNRIKDFDAKVQNQIKGGKEREEAIEYVRKEETILRRPHSIKTDSVDDRKMPTVEDLPDESDERRYPEEYYEYLELCLEELSKFKYKLYQFIFLWAYEDLKNKEIAKIIKYSEATVTNRKHDSFDYLRRCIERKSKQANI